MSQFDDNMEAMVRYFNDTPVVTKAAAEIKDRFSAWYSNLGWYDKNVNTDETWNQARNYRNSFNLANVTSQAEKKDVQAQIQSGYTYEQAHGKPIQAKTSEGMYAAPDPDDKPLIPPEYKIAAVVIIGGGILFFSYGLATALPAAVGAWFGGRRYQ